MSPGKHAPESPKSFLVSLGIAVAGAAAALGIVVGIALVALNAGSEKPTPQPTLTSFTPTASATATASASLTPSASPSRTPLPVKDTPIAALNGTTRPGLARGFAGRAEQAGYPVKRLEPGSATAKSTIYYRAGYREEAVRFQGQFPEFTLVVEAPSTFKTDVILTVVVGDDYTPPPSPSGSAAPSGSPS